MITVVISLGTIATMLGDLQPQQSDIDGDCYRDTDVCPLVDNPSQTTVI